jgi:hypothetical protein
MIPKRNLEACEHDYEYWKQNTTHSAANRAACLEIATQMMALLKAKAPASAFLELDERCEAAGIDGHGPWAMAASACVRRSSPWCQTSGPDQPVTP